MDSWHLSKICFFHSNKSFLYTQINKDLADAAALLTSARLNKSHINLSVVKGLQARVALVQQDWANAAKFAADFPDQANPIPTGENWSFLQSRNGDAVDVYGFEVAFQRQLDFLPGKFLKGFGIYLNYTYTKSKAKGIADEDGNERKIYPLDFNQVDFKKQFTDWKKTYVE